MGAEMGFQNTCMEMAAEMAETSPGKNIGRGTLGTLPVYFQFTSGLLPGKTSNTNAGSHGATGRLDRILSIYHSFPFVFQ